MGHMEESEEPQLRVEDFTEIITKEQIENLEATTANQKELLNTISESLEKETKKQEAVAEAPATTEAPAPAANPEDDGAGGLSVGAVSYTHLTLPTKA